MDTTFSAQGAFHVPDAKRRAHPTVASVQVNNMQPGGLLYPRRLLHLPHDFYKAEIVLTGGLAEDRSAVLDALTLTWHFGVTTIITFAHAPWGYRRVARATDREARETYTWAGPEHGGMVVSVPETQEFNLGYACSDFRPGMQLRVDLHGHVYLNEREYEALMAIVEGAVTGQS